MEDNTTSTGSQEPGQTQSAPPAASPATTTPAPTGGGMVSQEEKTQAMLVWVLTIFFGFVPGLIFYLISKEKPFVYRHAGQALAFTICVAIIDVVCFVTVVGIVLVPFVWLGALIVCIMAAMAANKGDDYNPPLTSGLAKSMLHV